MKKAIKSKKVKKLISEIKENYDLEFSKKDRWENDENIILINNEPLFFYYENKLVPTLKLILQKNILKTITVDMGAVKFVAKGADIMRAGITEINEFEKSEFIAVVDETHGKPLAIGLALFSSTEMSQINAGKVVKNLHYVGDSLWNYH